MRNLSGTLLVAAMLTAGTSPHEVEFRHLYTFGSKEGIHPPKILNRKAARAALGDGDHPYGLMFPVGVTTDLHHRVWIADGVTASVHVFDPKSGAYREIKRAAEVPFRQLSAIASDNQGRVYVADAAAGCIFVFDETGEYDHALMKRERVMESPGALAISEDSKSIYVADPPRNVVVELNREGEVNATIHLPPELYDPTALSVIHNQIYVLGGEQHRVGIFSPAGRQRGEVRWDGVAMPLAFAFDTSRNRFMVVNPRWMIVQVFQEDGTGLGAFGQRGDGVDQMQRVDAMHVDSGGLVYLVDSRHGKVLVFGDAQKP
jgi:DNA-binding beta-propeller fold protein YncE